MQQSFKQWGRALGLVAVLGTAACNPLTIDPVTDPNNQSLEGVLINASPTQLVALATGLEASYRLQHTNNAPYNQLTGIFGREVVIVASNEPRWINQVMQGPLDPAGFYGNGSYNAVARIIRAANILRQSAAGTPQVTDAQKQGFFAFADTYEALGKLQLVNLMGENGIRIDVADFRKPGKFTAGSAPALANIRQLLDQGAAELAKAGSAFAFPLSGGYAGFDTPPTFLRVNRALAARVALYQKDYAGALTAIGGSFYSPTAALTLGPNLGFSPGVGGDEGNSYFQVPDQVPSTLVGVPNNFVTEAEAGDKRLSKVSARTTARTLLGVVTNYDPVVYASQTTPVSIIRNEELILIAAEAKANANNPTGAVADLNVIRTVAGGLPAYTGAVTTTALVDEVLRQRRYSLFYEGQFWVDLRRTGRLRPNPTPNISLPYTAAPFVVYDRLPIPDAEIRWDQANP